MTTSSTQAHSLISPSYQLIAFMTTPYYIPNRSVPSAIGLFERITAVFENAQSSSAREIAYLKEEIIGFMQSLAEVITIKYENASNEPLTRAKYISRYALNALKSYHSYAPFFYCKKADYFSFSLVECEFYCQFKEGNRFERGAPLGNHVISYTKGDYPIAVKSIPQKKDEDDFNEADFMRLCEHPNVMPLTAILESTDTTLEFAMPYCSSEKEKVFTLQTEYEALSFLIPFLRGIDHIHSLDVVHRNIGPNSFFKYERASREKWGEFELTSAIGGFKFATFAGSEDKSDLSAYSAPEQVLNQDWVDASNDIWAIGALLFEILYGKPLFKTSDLKMSFEAQTLLGKYHQKDFDAYLYARIKESRNPGDLDPDFFLQYQMQNCLRVNPEERILSEDLLDNFENRLYFQNNMQT